MFEDEPRSESGAADRLIFFSDAVVAIAITLLALDLPVPTGTTVDGLWSSVQDHAQSYLAFVISFLVIAAMWSEHHHVFRYAARSDAWLRSLDMVWLLMVVLNPFATKLLTSEAPDTVGAHALRWGFYALLQMLASVTFLAMVHHMMSHDLQAADTPSSLVSEADWRSYAVLLGFGLSIPFFLWSGGHGSCGSLAPSWWARFTGIEGVTGSQPERRIDSALNCCRPSPSGSGSHRSGRDFRVRPLFVARCLRTGDPA